MIEYLFDHPAFLITLCVGGFLLLLIILLYGQSVLSKRKQQKISRELAEALHRAENGKIGVERYENSELDGYIAKPVSVKNIADALNVIEE